jgi:hypothetical protein
MVKPDAPRRIVMRVELLIDAKSGLDGVCDRLGMTRVAALSRVLEWFAGQDEMVQGAILNLYPATIRAQVAELILKKRANK